MKKILIMMLALLLLAGCNRNNDPKPEPTPVDPTPEKQETGFNFAGSWMAEGYYDNNFENYTVDSHGPKVASFKLENEKVTLVLSGKCYQEAKYTLRDDKILINLETNVVEFKVKDDYLYVNLDNQRLWRLNRVNSIEDIISDAKKEPFNYVGDWNGIGIVDKNYQNYQEEDLFYSLSVKFKESYQATIIYDNKIDEDEFWYYDEENDAVIIDSGLYNNTFYHDDKYLYAPLNEDSYIILERNVLKVDDMINKLKLDSQLSNVKGYWLIKEAVLNNYQLFEENIFSDEYDKLSRAAIKLEADGKAEIILMAQSYEASWSYSVDEYNNLNIDVSYLEEGNQSHFYFWMNGNDNYLYSLLPFSGDTGLYLRYSKDGDNEKLDKIVKIDKAISNLSEYYSIDGYVDNHFNGFSDKIEEVNDFDPELMGSIHFLEDNKIKTVLFGYVFDGNWSVSYEDDFTAVMHLSLDDPDNIFNGKWDLYCIGDDYLYMLIPFSSDFSIMYRLAPIEASEFVLNK